MTLQKIKYPGELPQCKLDPIIKELRAVHDMNQEDIYNFVNSPLGLVEDALQGTSYKVLRDENRKCYTIAKTHVALPRMRHQDFIMHVKNLGLSIDIENREFKIAYDDYTIAIVHMDIPHCMTQYAIEDGEDPEVLQELFHVMVQYANTPVEWR